MPTDWIQQHHQHNIDEQTWATMTDAEREEYAAYQVRTRREAARARSNGQEPEEPLGPAQWRAAAALEQKTRAPWAKAADQIERDAAAKMGRPLEEVIAENERALELQRKIGR